jgi:hypothetical protein
MDIADGATSIRRREKGTAMSEADAMRALTFETLLTDPLVHMMMQADGVTMQDMLAAMLIAHKTVTARERLAVTRALMMPATTSAGV